jgi:acetylornithine deacetylase/succinyl-diaminopimelate desuccinylase-like protein
LSKINLNFRLFFLFLTMENHMAAPTHRVTRDEFNTALRQLGEFVAIPSLSNQKNPEYNRAHLDRAAQYAGGLLREIGFSPEFIKEGDSPYYVVAERIVDATKPTLLLYGHYDVQPVDREKWTTDPFVVEERDGRLYGRGTSDDKGGIVGIITALGSYQKAYGALPVNVKILFEGEEEYGSGHMKQLLDTCASRLKADALVILDGSNVTLDSGTLTSSTRGILNLSLEVKPVSFGVRLEVQSMDRPVHSGVGCLVPDPSAVLAKLMVDLKAKFPEVSCEQGVWGVPHGGNSIQSVASCVIGAPFADREGWELAVVEYLTTHPEGKNFQIKVKRTDVKPGSEAPFILAKLMESLKNPRAIPGFMDGCKSLNEQERRFLRESSPSAEAYAADHKLLPGLELRGNKAESVNERITEEPSISFVNGGWGAESVSCQVGVRLTAGQDPERISKLLVEYLSTHPAGKGFQVLVKQIEDGAFAWKGDVSRPLSKKYLEALAEHFKSAGPQPIGGALPFLLDFERAFPGIEIIIPGVEDPACGAHSHNESLDIALLERAINSMISFIHKVGKV